MLASTHARLTMLLSSTQNGYFFVSTCIAPKSKTKTIIMRFFLVCFIFITPGGLCFIEVTPLAKNRNENASITVLGLTQSTNRVTRSEHKKIIFFFIYAGVMWPRRRTKIAACIGRTIFQHPQQSSGRFRAQWLQVSHAGKRDVAAVPAASIRGKVYMLGGLFRALGRLCNISQN